MAHIRTIEESQAEGELAQVYATIAGASGRVATSRGAESHESSLSMAEATKRGARIANILKAESLAPRALAAHYALYRELLFGANPLARLQRELIAVAVSQTNSCHY